MTSESAPRFTRENLALGAVVLPVRKDDARRQSKPYSGAHSKYPAISNPAIATHLAVSTSSVNRFGFSTETLVEKASHKVPSIRVMDIEDSIHAVDEGSVDISKRDGPWKKNTAPLKHVRRLSKDLAAKMKIRSGQVKPTMPFTQEKGSSSVLTEKLSVEKHEGEAPPRPSGIPSKRTRSIWGYIIGSSR
jgi:hypothetical protein